MLQNVFGGKSSEERFWEWFQRHEREIRSVKNGSEPIVSQLATAIKKVHPSLVFEAGKAQDGVHEFIVSADGIRELIPKVESLVAAAPPMDGWRVLAFRQRHHGGAIRMGDRTISPDSIFYEATPNDGKLDLNLYIEGLDSSNRKPLIQCCFLLLDAQVGEYDVMTRIGQLDFKPLAEVDGRQKPLTALPEEIDRLKAAP